MFLPFFDHLRRHGVPVTLREFLAFLEGMQAGLATYDIEAFYFLARTIMVKDERNLDKFDRAFAATFDIDALSVPGLKVARAALGFDGTLRGNLGSVGQVVGDLRFDKRC